MAIDFGRMARGVATGYLSAKIANTEANDRLKEDILRKTGENFYNNTLPEFQKKETNRRDTYNKLKSLYDNDVAEYMDQQGLITGEQGELKFIVDMLKEDGSYNEAKLKAYLEATKAGTYGERAEKRFKSIEDRENFIMNNMTKNGFGTNTIKNQLGLGLTKEEPMKAEAPTMEAEMPAAPAPTEDTTTTKLPTFEEIFGDTTDSATVFLKMKPEDQVRLQKLSNDQFKADTLNEVSGMRRLQESYTERYNNLDEAEQKRKTLNQFARERYFEEVFLPDQGLSYSGAKQMEPEIVTAARYTISILRANNPDDPAIEEIKNDLRQKLGTNNLSEYGL